MSDDDVRTVYGITTRQKNLKWADPTRMSVKKSDVAKKSKDEKVTSGTDKDVSKTLPKAHDPNCAKWADPEEFKSKLLCVDMLCDSLQLNTGGVPLMCDGKIVYVDPSDQHTLVIGSTGSKKSRLICMPMIEILVKSGESMMVADPKGELYQRSFNSLKEHGYDIKVINLRKTSSGIRWNPFKVPYDLYKSGDPSKVDKAREMIQDLAWNIIPIQNLVDPYWEASAQSFFYGLAWAMMTHAKSVDEVNMRCLVRMKNEIMQDEKSIIRFRSMFAGCELEYIAMSGSLVNAETTRKCIMSFFDRSMWSFNSQEGIADLLSGNDIDFTEMGHKKTALFVIVPDEKDSYNQIVSMCVKQLYEMLIMEAQTCDRQRLPVRVNFILDEFASFPRIPSMQNMITASRSRNIRFLLIIQSIKQLKAVYLEDADTIKSNCMNWIFLTSRDIDLMRELCEIVGKDENGRDLITTTRLRTLDKDKGEALILSGRLDPMISNLADIDDYGTKVSDDTIFEVREFKESKTYSIFARKDDETKKKAPKKKASRIAPLKPMDDFILFGEEEDAVMEIEEIPVPKKLSPWDAKARSLGGDEFMKFMSEPAFKGMPHNDATLAEGVRIVNLGYVIMNKDDDDAVMKWCTENQVYVGMNPDVVRDLVKKMYWEIF